MGRLAAAALMMDRETFARAAATAPGRALRGAEAGIRLERVELSAAADDGDVVADAELRWAR